MNRLLRAPAYVIVMGLVLMMVGALACQLFGDSLKTGSSDTTRELSQTTDATILKLVMASGATNPPFEIVNADGEAILTIEPDGTTIFGTSSVIIKPNGRLNCKKCIGKGQIADGAVGMSQIAPGAVGTGQIAQGAVGIGQIAQGAVGIGQIAQDAVGLGQIAQGAVGIGQIAQDAVGLGQIAQDAVEQGNIAQDAVEQDNIATAAVGRTEVEDGVFVTITEHQTIIGEKTFDGPMTIFVGVTADDLSLTGNVDVGGSLTVDGPSALNSASISGSLEVGGAIITSMYAQAASFQGIPAGVAPAGISGGPDFMPIGSDRVFVVFGNQNGPMSCIETLFNDATIVLAFANQGIAEHNAPCPLGSIGIDLLGGTFTHSPRDVLVLTNRDQAVLWTEVVRTTTSNVPVSLPFGMPVSLDGGNSLSVTGNSVSLVFAGPGQRLQCVESSQKGTTIVLAFGSSIQVSNTPCGVSSDAIVLTGGSLNGSAGALLVLIYDGNHWVEVTRL